MNQSHRPITRTRDNLLLTQWVTGRTLSALLFAAVYTSLTACIAIVIDAPDVPIIEEEEPIVSRPIDIDKNDPRVATFEPRCELPKRLIGVAQETGSWCWVASTQMVINNISADGVEPISQCDLITEVLKKDLDDQQEGLDFPLSCCQALEPPQKLPVRIEDQKLAIERTGPVCLRGGWPGEILDKKDFDYNKIEWTAGQDMSFDDVKKQFCEAKHPFIFIIRWTGGGRHSAVVGGYRETANHGQFVEVYDHSGNNFFVMPYAAFRGVPGDFHHELDYVDIHR